MILGIKTDQPEATICIFNDKTIEVYSWQAHRQLSDTIHIKIQELLNKYNIEYKNLTGLVVFIGPGSFTGLRIGITVANTLAYSLNIPIVGTNGEDWFKTGLDMLKNGKNSQIIQPEYGAPVHITQPKK